MPRRVKPSLTQRCANDVDVLALPFSVTAWEPQAVRFPQCCRAPEQLRRTLWLPTLGL